MCSHAAVQWYARAGRAYPETRALCVGPHSDAGARCWRGRRLLFKRDPTLTRARLLQSTAIGLLVGGLWFQLAVSYQNARCACMPLRAHGFSLHQRRCQAHRPATTFVHDERCTAHELRILHALQPQSTSADPSCFDAAMQDHPVGVFLLCALHHAVRHAAARSDVAKPARRSSSSATPASTPPPPTPGPPRSCRCASCTRVAYGLACTLFESVPELRWLLPAHRSLLAALLLTARTVIVVDLNTGDSISIPIFPKNLAR